MKKPDIANKAAAAQKGEITEHFIYLRLAGLAKNDKNREILEELSRDELKHYDLWRTFTGREEKPGKPKVWLYCLFARILGLTFSLKLMGKGRGRSPTDVPGSRGGVS